MFFKGQSAQQQYNEKKDKNQYQQQQAINQQYGNQNQYQPYQQQQYQQQPQQVIGQPYQQQNQNYNQYPSNQRPIDQQQRDYEQQYNNQGKNYVFEQQKPQPQSGGNYYEGDPGSFNLKDDVIRSGFVRKVLMIIGVQMIVTTLFVLIATFSQGYRDFTRRAIWLLIICIILSFAILIALYCFRKTAKEVPKNYILLFLYTFCESYLISCICATTTPWVVLQATAILTLIVFGLSIYAIKTKRDITTKIAFFMWAPFALIALVIVGSLFASAIVSTIISLIIILVFSAYLVFDIQRLVNPNNNKYTYGYDDYIIAALDIYIDVVTIFQQLLHLLS